MCCNGTKMEFTDSIMTSLVFYMALAEGYEGILLFIYLFIFKCLFG